MGSKGVSDEIRQQIKVMWEAGLSAGVIAQNLGRSRNSCIGIVSRMKLPSRDTEIATPRYHWPTDTPRVRKKLPTLPKPPILATEIITVGIRLADTKDNQCRYPLWAENGAPEFKVCGSLSKGTYCEPHKHLTNPPKPTKEASAS